MGKYYLNTKVFNKMEYCIVSAGMGSRFKPFSEFANKALAPLPDKPLISKIIESIPQDSKIHIVTGYKGDDLKFIISKMHKDRPIFFYENKDYASTGMGDSLMPVLEKVKQSLVVLPNDGFYSQNLVLDNQLKSYELVLGISDTFTNKSDYCQVCIDNGFTVRGISRGKFSSKRSLDTNFIFTGLLYIKHPMQYKQFLEKYKENSREIYFPIVDYIKNNFEVKSTLLNWQDCGTYKKYKMVLSNLIKYDFSKSNETILIYKNNSVFKIFKDSLISKKRIKKSNLYQKAFPYCSEIPSGSGYYYKFTDGGTLYDNCSAKNLNNLLYFLDTELWNKKISNSFLNGCARKFYEDKTKERINLLNEKYNLKKIKSINQKSLSQQIIPKFNFEDLVNKSIFCPIHGDLQYDNVIYNPENNKFVLIDWRHEFGGSVEYGDLYYDLAKLLGGIFINYKRIKKNDFKCLLSNEESNISYEYIFDNYFKDHLQIIREFHLSRNLDFKHTIKLMSLIFLNMAPLHTYPFDLMLLALSHKYYYQNG